MTPNTKILLHPETKRALDVCLTSNAHAFMLLGPSGSGKVTVALLLAQQMLEVNDLNHQPGLKQISPEKGSIGIDAIREAQRFTRLKTTGKGRVRRVLLVVDAQQMTIEAQNAFLKLLEEPPADTRIILTVTASQNVLATIYSRVQVINVQSPSQKVLTDHFLNLGKSAISVQKAYLLGGGQIGIMSALLDNQDDHPLLEYVDRAKQFLGQQAFERLAHLDYFAKTREEVALLLEALKRISSTAFEQAAANGKPVQTKHWHKIRSAVIESEKNLTHNSNVKLLLTDLSLNL